jgi:hypothetical protein
MAQQKIDIVRELIDSLDKKDFDLDVWKVKTILLLKTLFGANNEKIKLIENLHYDYSSWSLRDASGLQKGDRVKEYARQILEVAITELTMAQNTGNIEAILQNELTGAQLNELKSLIAKKDEAPQALNDFFQNMGVEKSTELLVKLITQPL